MHKTFTRRSAIAIIGGAVSSVALPVFAKQFETNGVAINGTDPCGLFHDVKTRSGQRGSCVKLERGHMAFCIGRKSANV